MNTASLFPLAWRTIRRIPAPVARGLFNTVAYVTWALRTSDVRQLERNLARVKRGASSRELRKISRRGMASYMRYYCEIFQLPNLSREQITARLRLRGDALEQAQADASEGLTFIGALGHLGNWDMAGAWSCLNLAPVTTVAERIEPEELFQEFMSLRTDLGMNIIPLDENGGGGVYRQLLAAARKTPGLIPLLMDRDLTAGGVEVDFFGQRARMAAGPAALAISTGARLYPLGITYERLHGERRRRAGSPWGLVIHFPCIVPVPDDVPKSERVAIMVQGCADGLAGVIAEHPEDWHMLQKIFVADLDPERDAKIRSEAS